MAKGKKKKDENLDDLFDDNLTDEREILPTGIVGLDYILDGGLRGGTSVEAYGPPASGKTSAGYSTIGQIQRLGLGMCVLFDVEGSWNPVMGKRLGIDTDHTMPNGKPSFRLSTSPEIKIIEELFDRIKKILYGFPEVRFIMVDSLAALVMRGVTEKDKDDNFQASHMQRANYLSVMGAELDRWIRDTGNKCCVYIVNHEKEEVGFGGHGAKKTNTPGGRTTKYLASTRLEFRLATQDKVEVLDPITGQKIKKLTKQYIRVQATKSRFSVPMQPTTFIFDMGKGIDRSFTAIMHAKAQGHVTVSGSWFTIPESVTGGAAIKAQGADKLAAMLDENPEALDRLEAAVAKNIAVSNEQVLEDLPTDPANEGGVLDLTDLA